jgi:hypothetical protein
MNRILLTTICLILVLTLEGQSHKSTYLGINILQLPALTINANLTFEAIPIISPIIDFGYTLNYSKAYDFVGSILTPHSKGANDGYDLTNQAGGYLKLGTFFNFRKDFDRKTFPRIGIFLTNSIIHQRSFYLPVGQSFPPSEEISQTKYIVGISTSLGYEFHISKRLSTNVDFQISFPTGKYKDLYGYRNYIPGMGFKDFEGYWFPMLGLNLKYKLNNYAR